MFAECDADAPEEGVVGVDEAVEVLLETNRDFRAGSAQVDGYRDSFMSLDVEDGIEYDDNEGCSND